MADKKDKKGKKEGNQKALVRKVSYTYVKRLMNAVSLLVFVVIIVASLQGTPSLDISSISFALLSATCKAFWVMICIGVFTRILIRILVTYEEMNSGQN